MIRAIVTDIEGTTSSIDFVKDVLFPYARKNLPAFIETHADKAEIQHWLHEAACEAGLVSASRQEIIDLLVGWIDEDRKSTSLKALQGLIWEEGYARGEFCGHVYPDVRENLEKWKKQGVDIYVYSSGSVVAQKLLFGHSDSGDLTPVFSGYFDTTTGAKREATSYRRIAEAIGVPASEILFLSDIEQELDAAASAGLQTIQLLRSSAQTASIKHATANTFNQISIS